MAVEVAERSCALGPDVSLCAEALGAALYWVDRFADALRDFLSVGPQRQLRRCVAHLRLGVLDRPVLLDHRPKRPVQHLETGAHLLRKWMLEPA